MFRIPIRPDLELRLSTFEDAPEIFDLVERNREHLQPWMPWVEGTRSAADVAGWIRKGEEQMARNEGWNALLWYQGRIAGAIGYKPIDWPNLRVEIGYWLASEFQRNGLMTDAARALTRHAFSEWGLNRVEIRCAVENRRSAAIPQRLGFTEEGLLRQAFRVGGVFQDLRLFGMLRKDWPGARG